MGIRLPQFGLAGQHPPDPAIAQNAERQGEEMELHPLPLGRGYLRCHGRHEGRGAPVEDMDFPGAQPSGGAGRVQGGITPADDRHPRANLRRGAGVGGFQKIQAVPDSGELFAGRLQEQALVAAHRQEDRAEVPAQILQLDVPSQPGPEAHLDSQLLQEAGLPVQDLPGQAVSRHIEAQGAA